MTLPEVQYESGGTTRRTDAEKYAERSPTQWEPKVQRTCSLFMQVKVLRLAPRMYAQFDVNIVLSNRGRQFSAIPIRFAKTNWRMNFLNLKIRTNSLDDY